MPYLNHYTLTTSHNRRSDRAEVAEATMAVVAPWVLEHAAIDRRPGDPVALPVPEWAHYTAHLLSHDGALIVTVYGPDGPFVLGKPPTRTTPLLTFGVATKSRHAIPLWEMLMQQPFVHPKSQRPPAPWCAVALYPVLQQHPEAARWMGDFERCVAWAWITRNVGIESAS
ncbi:hypothetical protein [Chitinimonas koreensis]|uniref:hypothetical protein n=1 Tax=Chitinimonas koreensis TaxID=356302 RepID=UPI0004914768|nr:hypothetical protein [Chitinimonas koreensis]QNM94879.1 hypothetical protein H9L41_13200 [Chitinimonas koreensis]